MTDQGWKLQAARPSVNDRSDHDQSLNEFNFLKPQWLNLVDPL
jgi:hypothetical protein